MNPIVLSFADGISFFAGLAMALTADWLLLLRVRVGAVRSALTVLGLSGVVCVVISATPLPVWAYVLWLVPVAAALIVSHLTHSPRHLRLALAATVFATTAGLCIAEIPHRRLPQVTV